MENISNKSAVLLSIFKRKGGEGDFTKIITNENNANYLNQLELLDKDEKAWLCFKKDDLNWLLLTNKRILEECEGLRISIPFSDLIETSLAIQEEFKKKIMNKEDFTELSLRDQKGNKYIIKIEKGKPYQGVYQVLHHIASKNQSLK